MHAKATTIRRKASQRHADSRSRLFRIHRRRQPDHVLPAGRRHPHRRGHRRGRPDARRAGAHRPDLHQPFAPGPRAGRRPAGRQRGAAPRRAGPPADRRACPGPRHCEALRTHVFNGVIWPDFSRLPDAHNPVLRFVPIAVGQVLDFGGPADRSAAGRSHRAGGRLCPARRNAPTPQPPGCSAAIPGPIRPCGNGWRRCAWPPWSSRPPSATRSIELARISRHLSPALLRQGAGAARPAGGRVHHPHQARRTGRGDGRDRPAGYAAPHPAARRGAADARGLTGPTGGCPSPP